jgi:DNA-binding XRE family transcriptional regulator
VKEKTYYVYTLAKPTGEVFYIGKGTGRRIHRHECEARNGVRSKKCNIIRKIWREGSEVIKTKVYETTTEQDALEYERSLIAAYKSENLANLTDGGEGSTGYIFSDATKVKMRLSHLGKRHTSVQNGEPRLKRYRLEAVLSQSVLARKANIDWMTVKRAEAGKPIKERKANAIAQEMSKSLGRTISIQYLGIAIHL